MTDPTITANATARRLRPFGTSIFTEMTRLAQAHDAVNLGQGFPDAAPEFLREAAVEAIRAGHNQYCRSAGIPELAQAVARHQKRFWGLTVDWESEVTITAGATEAICATLQGLIDPGDEVILFEPFYDSYLAGIAMAGGVPRVVTLRDPDFSFDPDALEAAITDDTRAILVNTPHNPTGKLFTPEELETIATLCRLHDLVAISDEVYEHLVYDGEHVPLASLSGMDERTVTISSAAKTFSITGWKIGWAIAPPHLTAGIRAAHQFVTFCNGTPFQHAVAQALDADDDFYRQLADDFRDRRDTLVAGLETAGLEPRVPDGTYFALADIRPLGYDDDLEFCRMLPAKVGVAAVPPSSFYVNKDEGRHLVRFSFSKSLETIEEGVRRLQALEPAGSAV